MCNMLNPVGFSTRLLFFLWLSSASATKNSSVDVNQSTSANLICMNSLSEQNNVYISEHSSQVAGFDKSLE